MTGNPKLMQMPLGMKDIASHWCDFCQFSMNESKHCDHKRRKAHTIDYIASII